MIMNSLGQEANLKIPCNRTRKKVIVLIFQESPDICEAHLSIT
jgi:hypothetical protein